MMNPIIDNKKARYRIRFFNYFWGQSLQSITNQHSMKKTLLFCIGFAFSQLNLAAQCNHSVTVTSADTFLCSLASLQLNALTAGNLNNSVTTWTPTTGLNDPTILNPIATPSSSTTYTVSVGVPTGNNLVVNGDFEAGATGFTSDYGTGTGGVYGLLTFAGNYTVNTNPTLAHAGFPSCSNHTVGGVNMLVVNGALNDSLAVWCQTISITPNTDYFFSMWVASAVVIDPAELFVEVNGQAMTPVVTLNSITCQWQEISFFWNSGSSPLAEFCIRNQNELNTGNDFLIDDILLQEVCVVTDSVFVGIADTVALAAQTLSICEGDSSFLSGNWQTLSGIYIDTFVSILSGCDSLIQATQLNVLPNTPVNLGADYGICEGESTTLFSTLTGVSFLWNNGSTDSSITVDATGDYYVTATNIAGCQTSDTINISVQPYPEVIFTNDTTLCFGQTLTLTPNTLYPVNYFWQDSSTNNTFNALIAGTYSVTVSDALAGCVSNAAITITNGTPLNLQLQNDTIICESIPWQIDFDFPTAVSFEWQDGSQSSSYMIADAGTYWVEVIDIDGCVFSDTIAVTLEAAPDEILYLPTDTTICKNNVITVRAFSPLATSYTWEGESAFYEQNDPTDTTFIITYPGSYAITAINRCGGVTQYLEVEEEDCGCYPYIPNGFTPNGDGINDIFRVFANCIVQDFELMVFDRWGNRVFLATDVSEGWDGNIAGQEAKNGVYVYQIFYSVTDETGKLINIVDSGDVTLIR
jgi:gliding motility-associated-like protein